MYISVIDSTCAGVHVSNQQHLRWCYRATGHTGNIWVTAGIHTIWCWRLALFALTIVGTQYCWHVPIPAYTSAFVTSVSAHAYAHVYAHVYARTCLHANALFVSPSASSSAVSTTSRVIPFATQCALKPSISTICIGIPKHIKILSA